jgi:hypothetical protein
VARGPLLASARKAMVARQEEARENCLLDLDEWMEQQRTRVQQGLRPSYTLPAVAECEVEVRK